MFSSFAAAHAEVANQLLAHLQESAKSANHEILLLFCPTVYCSAFTDYRLQDSSYLKGKNLDPEEN